MSALGPILAATDFSVHAGHAATRAACVAHETRSPLTLMHVLPGEPLAQVRGWLGVDRGLERERTLHRAAHRRLNTLAAELAAARHAPVATESAAGGALEEILHRAERLDARLLVLGARGASLWRRLVFGTMSLRLMHRTKRPLLVVRQTPRGPYRRVLVAVDFSPWSLEALRLARQMAPHARMLLLTAFEVPFEGKLHYAGVDAATVVRYRQQAHAQARQRLHELAHEAGLSLTEWEPCVVEGAAPRRIVEAERTQGCDLVVLGKHGQSATVDFLLGSVTREVLARGRADVLVSTRQAARALPEP
ncbi:universal stress protein [Piscinibacter gummiphilus]|uniref:Universal stress protein n=1 Tax=Piscinibacter gummiphilus TaxID=946333 RepID=A0ABZ0CMG9_9BURK|nr:universal stress protein [Piscinibacter gummiphilus]WOB06038.1 universal stress protein [Piscinibacter gummiphilus]